MNSDQIPLAYVNGEISPVSEARISILDRGFLFADGIYDVLRISGRTPLFFQEHMERLRRSAGGILIDDIPSAELIRGIAVDLIGRSGISEGNLYIQLTRGICPGGRRCDSPLPSKSSLVLMIYPVHVVPQDKYMDGVKVRTELDIRWNYNDYKTINLLPRVVARLKNITPDFYEVVYKDAKGHILEGTSTNVFIVKDGVVVTPPLSHLLLPGITRQVLIEQARKGGIRVEEGIVSIGDLREADECFLTGTTTEVLGVVSVDDFTIGGGRVGEVARRLRNLYLEGVCDYIGNWR
ncbi:MAG: aminotransferase class IV [Deltaproteobacteria bacterium]|nr:aminotransferase class IV [Deltaproteobacteria bacterium]